MVAQDLRELMTNAEKIWVSAESLGTQSVDLENGVSDKRTLATTKNARVIALTMNWLGPS